ncbi:response regulator [Acetivibrio saccincola]|jgi:two-component system chemotaxis response regulator CheY|uniref:Stage 0 sporulation protein A homolog n=1 Tax=Acetivibrio saccincola TaxID=1677857 RepID=A0A2K9EMN3_9FIRM|nr:response regulator [Acetivibrio saccincola]AUG57861.1 Transcriptional activator protein CzcR [Acetivibrio saccincola]PQQ67742.1 response regulator [Acetivibrio saccincola]HOA96612.1 response regulator [Acetivibrio saccincola]HQD29451.1 response regulator [Acetivibrio saccincola]
MRILIAEDDFACRKFLYKFLSLYGDCDITIDGIEAIDAYMIALDEEKPYDLICLDIMMPKMDGKKVLKAIRDIERQREIEESRRVKIIMTTALNDTTNVFDSFESGCEAYAAKPIDTDKFIKVMERLGLINKEG